MKTPSGLLLIAALVFASPSGAAPPQKPAGKAAAPKTSAKAAPTRALIIPASGDLNYSDLLTLAQKRLANPKTDSFTGEVTSQYSGRHFIIRQRVSQKLNGDWDYSLDSKQLTLKTDDLYEISLFHKSTPRGPFIGQTAMGVKFRIAKSDETSIVVSVTNAYSVKELKYISTLPPDEARRPAASAVVVLEGDLEASDGVLTTCEGEELDASLDDPTLVYRFECSIRAKLTRLALEDGEGKVLTQWPNPR